MGVSKLFLWITAAVLLFWVVGAYNRMVRQRNAILRSYADLDTQMQLRNDALLRQATALQALTPSTPEPIEALLAAQGQCRSAAAHARLRPYSAMALASLSMAEKVLLQARSRLDAVSAQDAAKPAEAGLDELTRERTSIDQALVFARQRFNTAVDHHNRAVQQFPTNLLALVFGFRVAGRLGVDEG